MYYKNDIKLPYFNDIKDDFIITKELLDSILYMKIYKYENETINSVLSRFKKEKDIDFINKYKNIIFDENIVILLYDYIINWIQDYKLFFAYKNESESFNINYLDRYHVDPSDLKIIDTIEKESNKNQSLLIFEKGNFHCFNEWNTFWISPIEYYMKRKWWFNEDLLEWPYSYINKKLLLNIENLDLTNIYISNKEKYWEWRFEDIIIYNKHSNNSISIREYKDSCLFYQLYFKIDKYMIEYLELNPFTTIEDHNEWKRVF